MEEAMEKRIWQRVRGEPNLTQALRSCLARQGRLWSIYRVLSRRGGKYRMLLEQKERQISCLRGLLRVMTGQGVAHPKCGEGSPDLMECFAGERQFQEELIRLAGEPELGVVFSVLAEGQKQQMRMLLEVLGTL